MKNSEYATAFDNGVLERFKNDPEWFKKIIARDSFYTNEGNVRHVRYIENLGNEDKPIVTLLKYIRPITPDSKNAIDDEVQISLEHLDGNSCVVLIAREDGDYLEPVTGTRVADACFYGGSAEEIYSYSIGKDTFEMTAFFPQLNFSVLKNQQISANILGLDKFKYDLANLNTAVAEIKKKIAEVKKNKPKKEDFAEEFGQRKEKRESKKQTFCNKETSEFELINPVAKYLPITKVENGIIYTKDHRYLNCRRYFR